MITTKKRLYKEPFSLINNFGLEKNNFITRIDLEIKIEKLPMGQIWTQFFIYKLIKYISIEIDSYSIFQTNGLSILSKIDLFENKYKSNKFGYVYKKEDLIEISKNGFEFFVPLFLTNSIPLFTPQFIEFKLMLNNIDTNIEIFVIAQINKIENPNIKNIIMMNQFQKIEINPFLEKIKEKIKIDGIIDHLSFYVEGDLIVDNVQLIMNDCQLPSQSYDILNKIQPFYYLNSNIPERYLFMAFSGNGQNGLNIRKIDFFDINIKFKKNNGGNIYLIAQNKNFENYEKNLYRIVYEYNHFFDQNIVYNLIDSYDENENGNDFIDFRNNETISVEI